MVEIFVMLELVVLALLGSCFTLICCPVLVTLFVILLSLLSVGRCIMLSGYPRLNASVHHTSLLA